MIIKEKKAVIFNKEYNYISLDNRIDFVCDRCLKAKKIKKYAEFIDDKGEIKRVCNACYSNICQGK